MSQSECLLIVCCFYAAFVLFSFVMHVIHRLTFDCCIYLYIFA